MEIWGFCGGLEKIGGLLGVLWGSREDRGFVGMKRMLMRFLCDILVAVVVVWGDSERFRWLCGFLWNGCLRAVFWLWWW